MRPHLSLLQKLGIRVRASRCVLLNAHRSGRSIPSQTHSVCSEVTYIKNPERKLSVFHGAANGNRTRNPGTTNPCDNRFTMAAMAIGAQIVAYFEGKSKTRRPYIYEDSDSSAFRLASALKSATSSSSSRISRPITSSRISSSVTSPVHTPNSFCTMAICCFLVSMRF